MLQDSLANPPVLRGYGASRNAGAGVCALQFALEAGPLTTIAAAIGGRPDPHGTTSRIVSVMGHLPGHLFHPTECVAGGTSLDMVHSFAIPLFQAIPTWQTRRER